VSRRRLIATGAALVALGATPVRADDHEPWRTLIPKVPPPPALEGPGELADYARLARSTAAALARPDGWVMPSGWYPMLFTRDAYWIVAGHRDPAVHGAVLARLRREQHDSGQAPTAIYIDDYRPDGRDRDDESTLLFVLMSVDAHRLGGAVDRASLERAAAFLRAKAPDGRYASSPGPYAYWLDTLALAGEAPCVAYVQGLYAVAAKALGELGIAVPPGDAHYRALFDPELGQLRCYADREGRFGQLRDVSALAGEALYWHYFGQGVLARGEVEATLAIQPKAFYPDGAFLGFRNIATADGGALPVAWLSDWPANTPGNYQNGGSWLLYDALAIYAGARHGIAGTRDLLHARLRSETRRRPHLHEYLSTAAEDPGATDPRREGYGWNGFVANLIESIA
jgi:hypothetical protein